MSGGPGLPYSVSTPESGARGQRTERRVISDVLLRRHDDLLEMLLSLTSADLSGCPADDGVDKPVRGDDARPSCCSLLLLLLRRSVTDVIGDVTDEPSDDSEQKRSSNNRNKRLQ